MRVRKAVIPAAGLGTRFLPATKSQPKEMLPLVDTPAIQYVVQEAVDAGCDDILIVTGRGKRSLEDHFDRSVEVEGTLEARGDTEGLKSLRAISDLAQIHYVRQKSPLGLGHAVACAQQHTGNEPFVVLLGDVIVVDKPSLLEAMIDAYETHGSSVVAVQEVERELTHQYGIVGGTRRTDGLIDVESFVEKPMPDVAVSNLASLGRYVLTPDIYEHLGRVEPTVGGEIQLTDALAALARDTSVLAYVFGGRLFDVGQKIDYVRATVELALERDDMGEELRAWLKDLVQQQQQPQPKR